MQLGLIPLMLGLGILLQKWGFFSGKFLTYLNKYLIWCAIPAIALLQLSKLPLSAGWWLPVGATWSVFLLAIGGGYALQTYLSLDRASLTCFVLVVGLGNTSFVGFPLIQGFYGSEGLQLALLIDQLGSFLALGTLGIWLASRAAGEHNTALKSLRKILFFPPFGACILALGLNLCSLYPTAWMVLILKPLAASLAPLALLSVGLQIKIHFKAELKRPLLAGLGYQLIVAPALVFVFFALIMHSESLMVRVCTLEAGMAPMISAAIVAREYDLNPDLANLMVGLGVPLSLVTVPLWHLLMNVLQI